MRRKRKEIIKDKGLNLHYSDITNRRDTEGAEIGREAGKLKEKANLMVRKSVNPNFL